MQEPIRNKHGNQESIRNNRTRIGCVSACMRTVFAGRHDDVGDCSVEVRVDDGRAGVGSPEAAEHAAQLAVVQLGEAVETRDAAGLWVIPGGVDAASVEREQLRLAAQRYHPRDHHRACSGGDHLLYRTSVGTCKNVCRP